MKKQRATRIRDLVIREDEKEDDDVLESGMEHSDMFSQFDATLSEFQEELCTGRCFRHYDDALPP
jgi:hypothetical protein